ncbi:MAG TPA: hypothetical protein VNI77_11300, partial [Nitrososphaera sp.]|nr:hypothetical protein [Nitrososphaera sp.]
EDFAKLSVDELVNLAKNTTDDNLKIRYWRAALTKLQNGKKFNEMISLLDSVDGDDFRKVSPEAWEDWRTHAAVDLAILAFKQEDIPLVYNTLDKTPTKLRILVRLALAREIKNKNSTEFYFDNVNSLTKELDTNFINPEIAVKCYLTLVRIYLDERSYELQPIFEKLIKYVDKADSENPNFEIEKDWADLEPYIQLDAKLIELDEVGVMNSLESLSSRRGSLRIKNGLLESSIKYLLEYKNTLEKTPNSKNPKFQ